MEKLREFKEYEGNPVGLSEETCETMRRHLDRHLATHWLAEGPQFHDPHLFLEDNYHELHQPSDIQSN